MAERFESPQQVLDEQAKRGLPKGFCLVPFTTLLLEPDGQVGSCRHKGSEQGVGDIRKQSLEEIWNGPAMRQWRREFLEGKPKICQTEVRHRACHTCPSYNSLLPDIDPKEIQTRMPIRLGINFNGKCNLHCQMCTIWQKPNGLYDQIGFWDQLEGYLPGLKEVELLSGEPMIQKDTYRLIDLLSEKNPECLWTITSNGHWKLTQGMKNALDKVRFKNLIVSIDSLVPETYARIRRGGELSVPMATLVDLQDYERSRLQRGLGPLGLRLNFLIQKDNWQELGAIHEFGRSRGLQIFRTFLYEPRELSLLSLADEELERILEHYLANLSFDQLSHSMRVIVPLMDKLPPLARADFLQRFHSSKSPSSEIPQ